jgi:hypothetical protein
MIPAKQGATMLAHTLTLLNMRTSKWGFSPMENHTISLRAKIGLKSDPSVAMEAAQAL